MKTESEVRICRLELKYCERCGALWVRLWGKDESYCGVCVKLMDELPKAKKRRTSRRTAHRDRQRGRDLQAVAGAVEDGGIEYAAMPYGYTGRAL